MQSPRYTSIKDLHDCTGTSHVKNHLVKHAENRLQMMRKNSPLIQSVVTEYQALRHIKENASPLDVLANQRQDWVAFPTNQKSEIVCRGSMQPRIKRSRGSNAVGDQIQLGIKCSWGSMADGGRRLEFGGQNLEVGVWRSEFGGRSLEVGAWRLEVGGRRSEVEL